MKRRLSIGLLALAACSGSSYDIFPQGDAHGATSGAGPTTGSATGVTGSPSSTSGTGESSGGASTGPASGTVTTDVSSTTTGGTAGNPTAAGAGGAAPTSTGSGGASGGTQPDAGSNADAAARETGAPPDGAVFVSACTGKSRKMTTADPFVGDFENGNLRDWYDYGVDGPINRILNESPGAVGSSRAVHLSATGLTSFGAGVGIFIGCTDVSDFDGVSFWAKGLAGSDNIIQFQAALPATHQANFGGDCTMRCNDHPSKRFSLTADWKQYTFTFAELAQAGFGGIARYNGIIMAMNWVSFAGPTVNFWVDEVALYRGVASSGPVGRGRPPQ